MVIKAERRKAGVSLNPHWDGLPCLDDESTDQEGGITTAHIQRRMEALTGAVVYI